jgi:Glycosyl hydrolases family 43
MMVPGLAATLVVLTVALALPASAVTATRAGAATAGPEATAPRIAVGLPATPAFADNAGDPDVIFSDGNYYAFTTGTVLGNHLQALVDTSGDPTTGWRSYTGTSFGSTALPNPPAWQQIDTQSSPGVAFIGTHWVLWYDASIAGHSVDSGFSCLAVATASNLTPTHPVFTDTSAGSPWCPAGGVLDPSPFIDPVSKVPYLVWKSNDGSSAAASQVWGVRLTADGTGFIGSPTVLMTVTPGEQTTDNPQLVISGGAYSLLFSGGNFENSSYNEQFASCAGPLGPCQNPAGPFLTTFGGAFGPGGGAVFQDAAGHQWLAFAAWNHPCTNCTSDLATNKRELYIASTDLLALPPAITFTGMASTPSGNGYWLVDSAGAVHPHGAAVSYGSMAGIPLNAPISHLVPTPDGHGYWMVAADGGIFSFGDARFFGSMGGRPLNAPVVDLAPTPDGKGYWLVASDGGIFSFGDARFFGSMGGLPLNRPVVGMAAAPGGTGYWMVATDGGIFAFGTAGFHGSTGALTLNRPVNGMAATPNGHGYWMVASDGGIFAFGNAGFHGSAGNLILVAPVTGMAADPAGRGYWLVAADGGVFSYGPPFFGSH